MQQFQDDLAGHRLAGLVIDRRSATAVDELFKTNRRVPCVHLWADKQSGLTPCLTVDGQQLMERSLRLLKEKGRR